MFGGGGMNPQKMQQMMKQMGIDVDEIDATEVVIKRADGDQLVFDNPDVTKMDARGQETYQIIGEPETVESAGEIEAEAEVEAPGESGGIPEDDIELVVQRTGATEADARAALEATDGDLAAAISRLE
ncbi:nascent polypeptide-associated complex protein [Halobacterium sp. KA-4]|uniref:nascent polypeptide-associated complex protein n=1 Tax=Halobacterium sp. KA-4 TaxID=2896367 RepID=UPI001E4A8240|nr:nascent polypeptide-associated complex protein [Halobacterium sp. KA-4]MCD2198425.1 nascent polypeptide-associated complex protein [Halobacterium sp. KA-4]